jgi:hypothetical protein
MKYNDSGAEAFIFTLIGLQVIYFALWVKRSVWSWLMFWLTNRSFMSNHVEEFLVREQFPRPPDYMPGPDEYFASIADDGTEDCSIRIKAAREVGAFMGITIAQQHQLAIQMRIATEDAIQRYAKRPPPVRARAEERKTDEVSLSLPKVELDTLAWLADYGFRLLTSPSETYRRSIDRLPYRQATNYAALLDKFQRKSVQDLLIEDEEDKERRFESQQNRQRTLWACYPDKG